MIKNKKKLPKKRLIKPEAIIPEWMANPHYTQTQHITTGMNTHYGTLIRVLSASMVELVIGDFVPAILLQMGLSVIVRSKDKPPQALSIYQKGLENKLVFQMTHPTLDTMPIHHHHHLYELATL